MPLPFAGLLELPFVVLEEVQTSARYDWDNNRRGDDPFVILQYTRGGEGRFECEGEIHRVPPGHVFIAIVPERSRYFFAPKSRVPWVFSWLNFSGELNLRLWREVRDHAGPVFRLPAPAVRLLPALFARTQDRQMKDPYESSRRVYDFYLQTLRHLPRRRMAQPFQDAALYFRSHYQKVVRMKEIAARLEMSREHFSRLFAEEIGEPPATFLRRVRLEAAARLLRTTDLPRAEIAFRTGWTSAAKLELFFKRHFGEGCERYRQRGSKVGKRTRAVMG